jgi:hypothetical protein
MTVPAQVAGGGGSILGPLLPIARMAVLGTGPACTILGVSFFEFVGPRVWTGAGFGAAGPGPDGPFGTSKHQPRGCFLIGDS